ncbi:phosphoadenosine phosphosulfate reductase [Celeribacter halophilus]|uniref:Phosphoadenosine phosphosulfate reductase n=1 Tax=Celeribacter halophilus TaxID=576117 RepID=A0AAW7XWU4_9RHOB|nr:phosphoadenosine phosphosulfate reductase [Celeribacter halophilus]MDO6458455.1 phosphoadenosine phosphosulfate reductase [Celeribacter halophilus]
MNSSAQTDKQIAWTTQLEKLGAEHGFFRQIDAEHKALFLRGDDTLVVTFDNLDDARQKVEDRLPWGVKFINSQGWSALGIAAHGWTWYRTEEVCDFFDELRDSKFFDQFKRVVFYGTSMAGYAAAAFSSAAPGATVIALSPQATLDRDITGGWETRFRAAWRRDFDGRYGYAPEEVATARKTWVFYDPHTDQDAIHAALFRHPNTTHIRCRHLGHNLGSVMSMMGALKPVVYGLVNDDLDESGVYRLLRSRRTLPYYQKLLLKRLQEMKRPRLTYRYCHAVLKASHPARRPHFANQMNKIARQLDLPAYDPGKTSL